MLLSFAAAGLVPLHILYPVCVLQAKAMQGGGGGDAKAATTGKDDALPGANFGPKYEAHVSEMQSKLDESGKR